MSSSSSSCASGTLPNAEFNRSLIVTADDFGLTVGVNDAIEAAYTRGILSTASLMVAGGAASDAVQRARRLPGLKVGLHLVLVEGATVLPRRSVPDLLDEFGFIPSTQLRLGFRYFFRLSVRRQLAAEIRAQFEAFRATGLTLDHANAHKHMHLHPTVGRLMISIGKEYGLRALRVPTEPPLLLRAAGTKPTVGSHMMRHWSAVLRRQARAAQLTVNDHVFGVALSGRMTAGRILHVPANLPLGLTEIYFHPASFRDPQLERLMPHYDHLGELECLLSPQLKASIQQAGIKQTTWTEHST